MALGTTVIGLLKYKGAFAGVHLQDVTYGESASNVEPMDEDGNIEKVAVYGKKKTIAANGNIRAEADLTPYTVGATVTVDSTVYTITSISIKESVTGAKTFTLNGEAPYAAAAVTP